MMLGSAKCRLQRLAQIGDAGFGRQIIDVKTTCFAEADDAPVSTAQDGTGLRAPTVNAKKKLIHGRNEFVCLGSFLVAAGQIDVAEGK